MPVVESAERGEWTLSEILILPLNLALNLTLDLPLNLTLDLPLSLSLHPACCIQVGGWGELKTKNLRRRRLGC